MSTTTMTARASVLAQWLTEGRSVVAGVLFDADGSSPLDPGAMMLIDAEATVEGTVTGGCVEAAVVAEAEELRADPDRSPRLVSYGYSDDVAGAVGLTCGGTVHLLVHEVSGAAAAAAAELAVAQAVVQGRPAVLATVLDGDRIGAQVGLVDGVLPGSLGGGPLLDQAVARDAQGAAPLGPLDGAPLRGRWSHPGRRAPGVLPGVRAAEDGRTPIHDREVTIRCRAHTTQGSTEERDVRTFARRPRTAHPGPIQE